MTSNPNARTATYTVKGVDDLPPVVWSIDAWKDGRGGWWVTVSRNGNEWGEVRPDAVAGIVKCCTRSQGRAAMIARKLLSKAGL